MSVRIQRASERDGPQILALRRAAEEWLASRGIKQWETGEVDLEVVERQLAANEWYVARAGGDLAGALRLLWSDEPVWQEDNAFAAYVHGLMVNRSHAGRGIGAQLLRWAEEQALLAGTSQLRLDCGESNRQLRAYYERQGFQIVGRRDFEGFWYSVVLLMKPLV